ncbi:MAG: ArsR family transcriptional regulator [Candidatus Heimdallarchaeota archaeon]|nr:ArsR family transcriptional regulator [Candidatus Heimdallarchaeota archaeon]
MLETLITSKTRLKLLLKFFLNAKSSSYLRELESEFHESTNAIRLELNRFEDAGLLQSQVKGNKKIFQANTSHPLYPDINNILLKYIGFDQIIDTVIKKLGKMNSVYVVGEFARGVDNHVIDLVFVCVEIDREYLARLTAKAEKAIRRKIRYLIMNRKEFDDYKKSLPFDQVLLLWSE